MKEEKEIGTYITIDITNLPKYFESMTTEGILEEIGKRIKEPSSVYPNEPQEILGLLVIDITYLPSEYRDMDLENIKNKLEDYYGYPVLLIDASRQNTMGTQTNNKPAYFI